MARSTKTRTSLSGYGQKVPPYTEQMQQFYEFATTKRVVRTGGVTKELTHYQVVMHKQLETALSGNSVAQRDLMRQAEIAVMSHNHYVKTQCETWTLIKDRSERTIDQARASKSPIPRVLPHPVDIEIDWTKGVTILGPVDEESWIRCDGIAKLRDALFVQQIMEDADKNVAMGERPATGAALVHGMLVNAQLPPSFRLSDSEVNMRLYCMLRMSRRMSLVCCREAWKTAGYRMSRGKHYGSLEKLEPMIEAQADLVRALRRSDEDPLNFEEAYEAFIFAAKAFGKSGWKRSSKVANSARGGVFA